MCGRPVAVPTPATTAEITSAGSASSALPWIVAGAAVLILGAVMVIPRVGNDDALAPAPPLASTPAGGPASVDLESMTPREAADRLFDRVMRSASAGDSAAARSFAPMAVAAYDIAEPLDIDGRYHVATLHLVAGNGEAAAAAAARILEEDPDHLFGLYTAAQAAAMEGDSEGARSRYGEFLEKYDTEVASGKIGYSEHAPVLPEMRREAVAATSD
jgi:hypothetical protein